MQEPNKTPKNRLHRLWERLVWRTADDSATSAGLQIREARWNKRVYRDPRFDQLTRPGQDGETFVQLPFRAR